MPTITLTAKINQLLSEYDAGKLKRCNYLEAMGYASPVSKIKQLREGITYIRIDLDSDNIYYLELEWKSETDGYINNKASPVYEFTILNTDQVIQVHHTPLMNMIKNEKVLHM